MAHFNFVISQNAKWGHAGFYIDCHRITVPENILLQKALDVSVLQCSMATYANHRRILTTSLLQIYQGVFSENI